MGEKDPDEIILKTSRVYFLVNYIIAILAIILLLLIYFIFDMKFTLFPKTKYELISTLTLLGVAGIGAAMIEQPEWIRLMRTYTVARDEVVETEGILSKRKIILPYQSISEITVRRSPIGRMLNYGDVYIGAFRAGSDINMRGIKNSHKIHEIIQNRINLLRKGQLEFWEVAKKKQITED